MPYYKIMAMDGGLGTTLASLLHGLQAVLTGDERRYMDQADLLVGTSVGAMTSLFFANHEDPAEALEDWDDFTHVAWDDVINFKSIPNFVGGLLGVNPIFRVDKLREFLEHYFGPSLTLGELKRKVMVVTFELDNGLTGTARSWRPRIFSNLEDGPDRHELVVDVALRSSALPIAYPIYQSLKGTGPCYVDGFVVANNPSMIAACELVESHPLDELLIFSIGTGANMLGKTKYLDPAPVNGLATWGYRQWLLDPARPLLLLDLMSQSSAEAIDVQCRKLLKGRYHRLEPVLVNELVPETPETEALLQGAASWLRTSGWLDPQAGPERDAGTAGTEGTEGTEGAGRSGAARRRRAGPSGEQGEGDGGE